MQMSEAGLVDLIGDEGEVLSAYRDAVGVWTIGVGLTAASGVVVPKSGMKITKAESRRLLALALSRNYAPAVNQRLGSVPQHVFDAALSFHFNTGAIKRASWVDHYKRGDMKSARASFLSWNKGGGRVIKGLVTRRAREWSLLTTGKYNHSAAKSAAQNTGVATGVVGAPPAVAYVAHAAAGQDMTSTIIIGLCVAVCAGMAGLWWYRRKQKQALEANAVRGNVVGEEVPA